MSQKKEIPFQIFKLARDLHLRPGNDPITAILNHCERQIKGFLSEMGPCNSLSEMLDWVAARVGTVIRPVRSDRDVGDVMQEYLGKREKCFVNLEEDLAPEVFGITYRLQNAESWEPPFVSVIDCRGDKVAKSYFTKWHEIAHLLTLTQQQRLVFRRTHTSISGDDPEEKLMDRIAGKFGFYGPIFHKLIKTGISFFEIERLRGELCPESSSQAAFINFIKYWPEPCIFVRAEMGFNAREEAKLRQGTFDFVDQPQPVLRAVRATANDKAREIGFQLFENMRVPQESIINRTFCDPAVRGEAIEDMAWWAGQPAQRVKVETRFVGGVVEALIVPA